MASIYLQHPIHGSKVACGEAEAFYDEGFGWERYDPTAPAPKKRDKKNDDKIPDFLKPKE